jgi:hypothetical protein
MKNSRTYKNIPLINPHDCALPTCHVVEGIGTFLIGDDGDEYEHHSSELLLQVTINGEIRGVIEEPTNVEDYFYVCGDSNDVRFLEVITREHPGVTPTLSELMTYRRFKVAELRLFTLGVRIDDEDEFIDQPK